MNEFNLIELHLAPLSGAEGFGLKDDAALMQPPAGHDLVLTKDTLVEGVHFPKGHYGGDTAEKLLRVNLSDLAAKGARPLGYLLSIAWPKSVDVDMHIKGFAQGLSDVQNAYDFTLYGGDSVAIEGPMVVSATLIGAVPEGQMVRRSGAKPGDDIWVSGTIGDGFLGLQIALGKDITPTPDGEALWLWEEAYYRPEPRLLLRKILRRYAHAAIDISDGLVADAHHLAQASEVGLKIELERLPLSTPTRNWCHNQDRLVKLATAGDDYEVLFTASPDNRNHLEIQAQQLATNLTRIGSVSSGANVTCYDGDGNKVPIAKTGFLHF